MTLSEIIERLEAGEETTPFPLSEVIARVVGTYKLEWGVPNFPLYATSIDAALTLVPPMAAWSIVHEQGIAVPVVATILAVSDDGAAVEVKSGFANTPALALCIASLKAREAQS